MFSFHQVVRLSADRSGARTDYPCYSFPFQVNVTSVGLAPTKLRLDGNYVLWYSNVARLVVTGIIPFASLTYLNSRIYTVIRCVRTYFWPNAFFLTATICLGAAAV